MSEQIGSTQRFRSLSTKRKADETPISISAAPSASSPASTSSVDEARPEPNANNSTEAPKSKHKKRKKHTQESNVSEIPSGEVVKHQRNETDLTIPKSENKKKKEHGKHKSHKAPKAGSTIFQDLLNRPLKSKNKGEGE